MSRVLRIFVVSWTALAALLYAPMQGLAVFWYSTLQLAGNEAPPGYTPWSSLGVLANGADMAETINRIPAGNIYGDCVGGSTIRLNSPWILVSNLNFLGQPGCTLVSYVSGFGSYAIIQSDLTTPLTNVTLNGLQMRKAVLARSERIMELYINHFTLVNFNIGTNGGFAFLRGSDQEIAYGMVASTYSATGNPGIRHIGNIPKVPTTPGRPANIWVHDNNMVVGDAPYQSCQPTASGAFENVSTDDALYENNSGASLAATWGLIGIFQFTSSSQSNFTCSNIIFRNNKTALFKGRGMLIGASQPTNRVSDVTIQNQIFDGSEQSHDIAVIELRSGGGGSISNVTFDHITVHNPRVGAFMAGYAGSAAGQLSDITVSNSNFDQPRNEGRPNVLVANTAHFNLTNTTAPGGISVNPPTAHNDAQSLRERVNAARLECIQQARGQGLRGPAMQPQVESCLAAKVPDFAKRIECRREAISKGIDQAGIPPYVLQCLTSRASSVPPLQAQPGSPTPSGTPPTQSARGESTLAAPTTMPQKQQFDQVRQACADAANAQDLKDYEFDRSVRTCFLKNPYVIARERECQQEGTKRGLTGRDLRPFIRRCMTD